MSFAKDVHVKNMQLYLVAYATRLCYINGRENNLGKKEKLIAKLRSNSKTFTFDEAETLLGYFSYHRRNKGKTSGSRIMFVSDEHNAKIVMHKPHPHKELQDYQVKQLLNQLEQEGLL